MSPAQATRPAVTLYGPRAAPVVEKVARGLALKGLDYRHVEPRSVDDYRRWSPTGRLPVVDIDGERIHDSTQILLRIDQLVPEPPLLARDARTANAQRRLAIWADETFVWYWIRWQRVRPEGPPAGPPISGAVFSERPPAEELSEPPRPAGVSLRSWIATRLRRSDASSETSRLVYEVGHRVDDVTRLLADRPFFFADRISIADLSVYAMLNSLTADSIPGVRAHVAREPRLLEYIKRVEQATGG